MAFQLCEGFSDLCSLISTKLPKSIIPTMETTSTVMPRGKVNAKAPQMHKPPIAKKMRAPKQPAMPSAVSLWHPGPLSKKCQLSFQKATVATIKMMPMKTHNDDEAKVLRSLSVICRKV